MVLGSNYNLPCGWLRRPFSLLALCFCSGRFSSLAPFLQGCQIGSYCRKSRTLELSFWWSNASDWLKHHQAWHLTRLTFRCLSFDCLEGTLFSSLFWPCSMLLGRWKVQQVLIFILELKRTSFRLRNSMWLLACKFSIWGCRNWWNQQLL